MVLLDPARGGAVRVTEHKFGGVRSWSDTAQRLRPLAKKIPGTQRPARDEGTICDDSNLPAYLASRRRVRMYVHIGDARPDGGDGPGKIASVELLAWNRADYDVCSSDSPSHAPS